MEADLEDVIRRGLRRAFPDLTALRALEKYQRSDADDNPETGVRALRSVLQQCLYDWPSELTHAGGGTQQRDAMQALLTLSNDGRGKRTLNGPDGLRSKAGAFLNVQASQFYKQYEKPLVADFAMWLAEWDLLPSATSGRDEQRFFSWEEVTSLCGRMARHIEREWAPDLVLTMSGPGSVAALYCMKVASRDVPVIVATTFPRREVMRGPELGFARATEAAGWLRCQTEKWNVYLPDVLFRMEQGARIAIVDDRVVTGETQRLVSSVLRDHGCEVLCAALFAPEARRDLLDFTCKYMDGDFEMPWGDARGRR